METMFSGIPTEYLPVLEKVFRRALSEIEKMRDQTYMPEVCSKRATPYFMSVQTTAKAAMVKISSGISEDDAVAGMSQLPPYPPRDVALAHLRFAMKQQEKQAKRERVMAAVRMRDEGIRNDRIAYKLGVSLRTVVAWLARAEQDQRRVANKISSASDPTMK